MSLRKAAFLVTAAVIMGVLVLTGVSYYAENSGFAGILKTMGFSGDMDAGVVRVLSENMLEDCDIPLGADASVSGMYFDGLRLYIKLSSDGEMRDAAVDKFRIASNDNIYFPAFLFNSKEVGKVSGEKESCVLLVFNDLTGADTGDILLFYGESQTQRFSPGEATVERIFPQTAVDGLLIKEVCFAETGTFMLCEASQLDDAADFSFDSGGAVYPVYPLGGQNQLYSFLIPAELDRNSAGTFIVTDKTKQKFQFHIIFSGNG